MPLPVPFPVYGLGPGYTGQRYLLMWDDASYLYRLNLGHGSPADDRWITVSTLFKPARPQLDTDSYPPRPLTLDHAAISAVHTAADRGVGRAKAARIARDALIDNEIKLIDYDPSSNIVTLTGWKRTRAHIDSVFVDARTRRIGESIAALIDLPNVIIEVSAPADLDPSALDLIDVRDRLAEYPDLEAPQSTDLTSLDMS